MPAARHARYDTEECHTISQSTQSTTPHWPLLVGGLAFVITLVLDQLSKLIVLETLGPDGSRDVVEIIPGVLRFIFVRNTGSAFGMFQGHSGILRILGLVAIVVLLVFFFRSASRDWLLSLALGLQLGGALGNIVDRFAYGYVVDWIDVSRWPTFNMADSAITVGVALLMYVLLFRDQHGQPSTEHRRIDQTRPAGDEG